MASTSSFPSLVNVMVICCSLWFLSLHPSRSEDVFFPSQPSVSSIQYRSLRDILFQSESAEIEASDLPVVLASFHPDDPSPTLASPPIASKDGEVSQIRFLDSDALSIPEYFDDDENYGEEITPTALYQEGEEEEDLDVEIIPPVLVRQSTSKTTEEKDRWSWPSTTKAIEESYQSRSLGSVADNKAPLSLIVKKTVAKPYRLLPRTASCPKLLHDLNITCSLPTQLAKKQPVVRYLSSIKISYTSIKITFRFLVSFNC